MMLRFMVLCFSLVLFLSGCTETLPIVSRPPDMTFANFRPIELNVARIDVQNNYSPLMADPNVGHLFPIPPYVAVEKLIRRQLVPAGDENILRVRIDEASVVREYLTAPNPIEDLFVRRPSEKLKAKILLRFELFSPQAPDIVIGHAEVIVRRTKTLLEGTPIAERDQAYFALTEDLMDSVNDGLKTIVKNTFGKKL